MRLTSRFGKAVITATLASASAFSGAVGPAAAQDSASGTQTVKAEVGATDIITTCRHNGRYHIVRTYYRGPARYTLRCGTSTWGWKHIRHRWSTSFSNKISHAIAYGQPNGGGFSTWTLPPCSRETFRVKIGTPAGINDVRTAYKVTATSLAPLC